MRRGRASRNKDRIKREKSGNEEPQINKVNTNNPSKQRNTNKFNSSKKFTSKRGTKRKNGQRKLTVGKVEVGKNFRNQDRSVDKVITGLEGAISKTYIKSSYKVSGLLSTDKKSDPKEDPDVSHESQKYQKSIRARLDFTRHSVTKENTNKENTSEELAKISYLKRKREYEKGAKPAGGLKHTVYRADINLTHRKAVSSIHN